MTDPLQTAGSHADGSRPAGPVTGETAAAAVERARWREAMALFEALQDLAPEARDARLREAPPSPEVQAILRRMFAGIGES